MPRIFISYRFTGEDINELKKLMKMVGDTLNKAGHEHYCTVWDSQKFAEEKFTGKQIMDYGLRELDKADVILFLVKSEHISEGMLVEAGYAIAKGKKSLLFINKNLKSHILRRLFENHITEFDNLNDLEIKLTNLKL